MSVKVLGFAAILISMSGAPALAQAVTPEQVKALPAPTRYFTPDGKAGLVINKGAFDLKGPLKCTGLTKAGGNGNATINCADARGAQYRFEWLTLSKVKMEFWGSMAAKAGALRNKQAQAELIMTRK